MILVACSDLGIDLPEPTPEPEPEPSAEALITPEDLEAAPLLPVTPPEDEDERVSVLEREVESASLSELTSFANVINPNSISLQSSDIAGEGFVSYLQASEDSYKLQLYDVDESETRLIYEGSNELQSVAVTANGEIISFIAELGGNREVFLLDIGGELLDSPETLVRLTDTDYDEADVALTSGVATADSFPDLFSIVWQGLLDDAETIFVSQIELASGEQLVNLPILIESRDGPVAVNQTSLSADGETVIFVADLGPSVGAVSLRSRSTGPLFAIPDGAEVSAPSLGANSSAVAALATTGAEVRAVYFNNGEDQPDLETFETLSEAAREHPFLSADAESFAYSDGQNIFLGERGSDETRNISEDSAERSFGAYWAKVPAVNSRFSYEGVNDQGPFTRLLADGLSEEERTVLYDATSFSVTEAGWYEVVSEQDYDGYLNLYEAPFDPEQPDVNLLTSNDDIEGSRAGIAFELEADTSYVIVTSACGVSDRCGPAEGKFFNTVTPSEPPPEPDTLPEPDNDGFDITLRFAEDENTDSLTEEQRAAFSEAAARWSEIITTDLGNIENFSLPANSFEEFGAIDNQVLDDVLIDVRFASIDGPGNILGSAGPRILREEGDPDEGLTIYGAIVFDINEFGGGAFANEEVYKTTVLHEMGHVLGIGTLWQSKNLTEGVINEDPPTAEPGSPNPDYDPRFIGQGAIQAYQQLLSDVKKPSEASVPIANTSGPGTINAHWRALDFGGELMIGFATANAPLSSVTAKSLGDLGYTVDATLADTYNLPLPPEFRLTAPEEKTYTELEDYLVAETSPTLSLNAELQVIDVNLDGSRENTSACQDEDFADFVEGNIALVQRNGDCFPVPQVRRAQAAGAAGVIIFNQGADPDGFGWDSFGPVPIEASPDTDFDIPVLGASFDVGVELIGYDAPEVLINTGALPGDVSAQALAGSGFNIAAGEILTSPEAVMSSDGKLKPLD